MPVIGLGTGAAATSGFLDPLGLYGGKNPPGLGQQPIATAGTTTVQPVQTAETVQPVTTETVIQPVAEKPTTELEPLPTTNVMKNTSFPEKDWNDLIDVVIAEAVGEGADGMTAVAHVIKNRALQSGASPGDVVREPKQFSAYSKPGDGARRAQRDPAIRAEVEKILTGVFDGQSADPTGGADHYHADYVSPGWAGSMTETTKIGRHHFYASGRKAKPAREAITIDGEYTVNDPMGLYAGRDAFGEVAGTAAETPTGAKDPEAKGLARLVSPEKSNTSAGGSLTFRHAGQDAIDEGFRTILTDTSSAMGRGLTITSGFRSPNHPVERQKRGGPGQHAKGTASDISMRGMSIAERQQLVAELKARGVKRFGTYSSTPDMLHVDMKDQAGDGSVWWMHNRSNRNMEKAPDWFRQMADGSATVTATASKRAAIVIDETYSASDPMGLYAGRGNPFDAVAVSASENKAAEQAAAAAAEQQAAIDAENQRATGVLADLEAKKPGRYLVLDEAEADAWKKKWEEENRSGGMGGDWYKRLKSGAAGFGRSLGAIADVAFEKLPGGQTFLDASDDIDRWLIGDTADSKWSDVQERAGASMTDRGREAAAKQWWDEEKGTFGPAWSDPRSYVDGAIESLPSTAATMLPGMALARGAYTGAIARGLTARQASAQSARTAALTGAVSEGMVAGGDTAVAVREQISAIPREQLLETEVAKAFLAEGLTEDEAVAAISSDAQTQAFIISGVATGAFGGAGDRMLAKIIADGVGGSVAKRIMTGTARGTVAEGLLEEAPQGAAQKMAENYALRDADPGRELTEGVGEAVAGGVAIGGTMGAGMGGAAAAARPVGAQDGADVTPGADPAAATVTAETGADPAQAEAATVDPRSKGPLSRGI